MTRRSRGRSTASPRAARTLRRRRSVREELLEVVDLGGVLVQRLACIQQGVANRAAPLLVGPEPDGRLDVGLARVGDELRVAGPLVQRAGDPAAHELAGQ